MNTETKSPRKVSTLEGMADRLTDRRRDGNTTRLIDNAIQILFRGDICVVRDHCDDGNNDHANLDLFERILKRLESEHGLAITLKTYKIEADKNALEIKLVLEHAFINKLWCR
jgi:hypothetical protein